VTLPARRKEWASKAIEIDSSFLEPLEYYQAKESKLDRGDFPTEMQEMLTAAEQPSVEKVQQMFNCWRQIDVLWTLVEKYSQHLTKEIGEVKDEIMRRYLYEPESVMDTSNANAEWTISCTLHNLMESSEEQVAHAIRQDAYKLQDENVFTKLNQVIKLKQPLIYDRLRRSFRGLLIIFGAGMSEPPELLNEFVAEYDTLVELWS